MFVWCSLDFCSTHCINKTEDPSVNYAGKGYLRVLNATKKQCFPEETIKNAKEPKVTLKNPKKPYGAPSEQQRTLKEH